MNLLHDTETKKRFMLEESPVRVGRSPDNDIVVTRREVSRHHCELHKGLFGTWSLKQLGASDPIHGSYNCTFVKRGEEVLEVMPGKKPLKLESLDLIAFGRKHDQAEPDFRFEYYSG